MKTKVGLFEMIRPFPFFDFPFPLDSLTDILLFPAAGSDNSCDWFYQKSELLLFPLRYVPAIYSSMAIADMC